MMAWERCGIGKLGHARQVTLEDVKHLPVWCALDLASKVDVAAKVRLFYDAKADHYYCIPTFWLPERAVQQGRNSQYSAGYYSYIWSEVLVADTVDWFRSNGGLRRANGDTFRRELLARGHGVEHVPGERGALG